MLTRIRKPPKKDLRCKKGGKVLVQAGAQVSVSSSGHYYRRQCDYYTGLLHNMKKTWVAVGVVHCSIVYCSIVYCYHIGFCLRILWMCHLIQLIKKEKRKGICRKLSAEMNLGGKQELLFIHIRKQQLCLCIVD